MAPRYLLAWLVAMCLAPLAIVAIARPDASSWFLFAAFAMAFFALADAMIAKRDLAEISIHLPAVTRTRSNRPVELPVRLTAGRGNRTLGVALEMPASFEPAEGYTQVSLSEGIAAAVRFLPTPRQRGVYTVRACHLQLRSRFGLWDCRRSVPVQAQVRVHPDLPSARKFAALLRLRQGRQEMRQLGQGREFEKLREYVPGDNYFDIHWKTTAKRGHPVTRLFQAERLQEIYVAVDCSRLAGQGSGNTTMLETWIETALLMCQWAGARGDLFGLTIFGSSPLGFLRAQAGAAHYRACRELLTGLSLTAGVPDFDEICSLLHARLKRRTMLLFLTSLEDPVIAEAFQRGAGMLARQHLVIAATLRHPALQPLFTTANVEREEDVHARLAGHLRWGALKQLEATLRHSGIRLALLQPDQPALQLAALYEDVKRRQLL